jgi:hypothetical protein
MAPKPEMYLPAAVMDKARQIYDEVVRPKVEAENTGRLVAIDVNSELYEVGDEVLEVTDRLRARRPDATIGVLRIGEEAVYRIGHFPAGRAGR